MKTRTVEYMAWHNMNRRCFNPKCKSYIRYGAKGITVCERWHYKNPNAYSNFFTDMGKKPRGYCLDRINGALGYFPSNCRWATMKQSLENRVFKKRPTSRTTIFKVIHIPATAHKILKLMAAENDVSLEKIATQAISEFIEKHHKAPGQNGNDKDH